MRAVLIVLTALAIAGCGNAVGYGKASQTQFASESSVTIEYDPLLTNPGEIQNSAQRHCAQYGKDAIPQGETRGTWGTSSFSFLCRPR